MTKHRWKCPRTPALWTRYVVLLAVLCSVAPASASNATTTTTCDVGDIFVEVVVAVDMSSSIKESDFPKGMDFVGDILQFLSELNGTAGTNAGVFAFGHENIEILAFGTPANWTAAAQTVRSWMPVYPVIWGTKTNTHNALAEISAIFLKRNDDVERLATVRLGIVLTDGKSSDKTQLEVALAKIRRENITMYSIGVGKECQRDVDDSCLNPRELEKIAGSENRTFQVEDYDALQSIEVKFKDAICLGIQHSNVLLLLGIGSGIIVAIVVATVVGLLVIYAVQDFLRKKIELAQLAAAEEAMKKENSDINPMYIDPNIKSSPTELGVDMEGL